MEGSKQKKYAYFIKLKEQSAFAVGAIYEKWLDKATGEIIDSAAIITTEANPLMAKIHNVKMRMPLIFDKDHMLQWIEPNLTKEQIIDLMKPFDETKMEAYTISKLITSRTENPNQAQVKDRFEY